MCDDDIFVFLLRSQQFVLLPKVFDCLLGLLVAIFSFLTKLLDLIFQFEDLD